MARLALFLILPLLLAAVFFYAQHTEPPITPQFGADESSYFAEIAPDGTVLRVIVADAAFINSGAVGNPANWIQTDKGGTIRKNPATLGAKYDRDSDAFIPVKRYTSWVADQTTLQWKPPKDPPSPPSDDFSVVWDEAQEDWVFVKVRNI